MRVLHRPGADIPTRLHNLERSQRLDWQEFRFDDPRTYTPGEVCNRCGQDIPRHVWQLITDEDYGQAPWDAAPVVDCEVQ